MGTVTDNQSLKRFELVEEGKLAFADYSIRDGIMILPHVEADPALRGKGAAGRLMEGVLEHARRNDFKVLPVCSYAVAYIERHPEHRRLLR